MFIVVSYDVTDDQRRNKLADTLKDYGQRVQYSVFECDLEKRHIDQMIREAIKCIDTEHDSLKIYRLCKGCVENIEAYGKQNRFDIEKPTVI